MSEKPNTERRRHKRYSVFFNCLVKYPETDPFACIIRDFSDGGMLLTIRSENDAKKIKLGDTLQLILTDVDAGQRSNLAFDARVVRSSSMGFGIELSGQSAAAMLHRLLRKIKLERPGTAAVDNSIAAAPNRKNSVPTACKQALNAYLDEVMTRFFQSAKKQLDEAAEQANNDTERTDYWEAHYDLEKNRDQIKQLAKTAVERNIDTCFEPGAQQNSQTREGSTNALSLIGQDEFEDWLNLSTVIARAESKHESSLSRLDQQLASMLDRQIDHASNPFAPAKLCEAFRHAIEILQLNTGIKNTIYDIFESRLTPHLGDLYLRINELSPPYSIDNGSHPTPEAKKVSDDSTADSADAASAPPPAATLETTTTQSDTSLFNTFASLIDLTAQRTTNSLGKTLAAGGKEKQSQQHRGETFATEFGISEVASALTCIQKERDGHANGTLDGDALKHRLRELLSQTDENNSPINQQVESFIDVGDRLFSGILSQAKFSPSVMPYVERLHLPLIRLAMMDPSFIESEDHPARQLLDMLDQAASAVVEDGKIADSALRKALWAIADQLAAIAPGDNATIERIHNSISPLIEPLIKAREMHTQRVIEVCKGRQKIQNARLAVNNTLKPRLAGKRVPTIILSLLMAGWEHRLLLEALLEGTGGSGWTRAVNVLDELLNWLSDDDALNNIDAASLRRTIDYIDEQLGQVGTDRFKHEKVLTELRRSLLADESDTPREPVEMTSVLANAYDRPSAAADRIPSELTASLQQVRKLQVGDWLLFQTDENRKVPLKLVWVDASQNWHVFVNRRGQKQLQLPINQLARHFKDGTVIRIESLDLPLMERTVNGMFTEMHGALLHDATHDPVTNLINRREFLKRLRQLLARPLDDTQVFCYLEVDHFRIIADRCGPDAIDCLARDLSTILKDCAQPREIITRLGDDTFGVLCMSGAEAEADKLVRRIHEELNEFRFQWQEQSFAISMPVGMLVLTNGLVDGTNQVLEMAGSACRKAKQQGRNGTQLYRHDGEHIRAQKKSFELVGRIDHLISDKHLGIRCQMITPVNSEPAALPHYEILLGVKDDSGKFASPEGFLTVAEQLKRMEDVDRWVINSTLSWIDHNRKQFEAIEGFSINISGQSLNSDQFLDYLLDYLARSKAPMEHLTFEITETVAIESLDRVENFINSVKRLGSRFSLDDFGTGFSSYAYLKSLDVDYLKIDGTFVKNLDHNNTDFAVVKSINQIGHHLGMKTIAEYVETQATLDVLATIGVDFAQGYAFGRPVLLNELSVETEPLSRRLAGSSSPV